MKTIWLVCAGLALTPGLAAERPPPARVGARLVKADLAVPAARPRLVVVDAPDAWRALTDEAFTGENPREFFFTLEGPAGAAAPTVEVHWPGVAIARVLGAVDKVESRDGVTRFVPRPGTAPTGVRTMLRPGRHVYLCIFHNWEVRRAGPYREGAWPATAIQAQLNYLLAAREAARLMGLANAAEPGFVGDIRLYGFETNFPNGHADHPPHFHIMLSWPGWQGTQATHFRLDADGRILHNHLQVDHGGGRMESARFGPGDVCRPVDRDGRVGFELTILDSGLGLIWHWPAGPATCLLRAAPEGAAAGVEVCLPAAVAGTWETRLRVQADDDAARGELRVSLEAPGAARSVEIVRYDPDTGAEL